MGVNSLRKTVTRQRRDCDLNPGPSVSSMLTTRLPSHPFHSIPGDRVHFSSLHKFKSSLKSSVSCVLILICSQLVLLCSWLFFMFLCFNGLPYVQLFCLVLLQSDVLTVFLSINQSINLLGNKGPKATYKSQNTIYNNHSPRQCIQ